MERYEQYFKYAAIAVLVFIFIAFVVAIIVNIKGAHPPLIEGIEQGGERMTEGGQQVPVNAPRRRAEGTALFMLLLLVIFSLIAIYTAFLYGRKCAPKAPLLELIKLERMVPLKINISEFIEANGEAWLVKATAEMAVEPAQAHITKDEGRRLFANVSLPAPQLEAPQITEAWKLSCDGSGKVTRGEKTTAVPENIRTKAIALLALAADTDENDAIMRKTTEDIIEAAFDSTGWIAEITWQDRQK